MQNEKEESPGNSPPPYKVSDLYLASFLRARGVTFFRAEKEGKKILFLFEHRSDLDRLVQDFYNNSPIPVVDYRNSLRDFKALIMQLREGGRP